MKTEWKVLTSLVVILFLMEIGMRAFETRLSKDVAHLRELPSAAQRLKESKNYKILIVGNSLARAGIDQKALSIGLEKNGKGKTHIEAFFPDSTSIPEWNYGVRRYFLNQQAIPDQIIMVTGKTHLLDGPTAPEHLGAFFVDPPDVKEAILMDLRSMDNIIRFFLARGSRLFANKARVQPYAFYNFLPKYEQTIQEMNTQRKIRSDLRPREKKEETTNFVRFIHATRSKGIAVSVVAIPMAKPYELPQEIRKEIEKQSVSFLDLSKLEGINEHHFFDGYHLDSAGGKRVTDALVKLISK